MRTHGWLVSIIVVLGVLLLAAVGYAVGLKKETAEARTRMLIDSAEIDGLEVTIAATVRGFADLFEDHDSLSEAFRAQGRRLEMADARLAALTTATVGASGSAEGTDVVVFESDPDSVDREAPKDVVEEADSIAFNVREPALTGRGVCVLRPPGCRFDYEISGRIALLHTVGPDGTLFVTAESRTEGFEVAVETLEWVPPGSPPWWSNPWTYSGLGLGAAVGGGMLLVGNEPQSALLGGALTFGLVKVVERIPLF